MDKVQVSELYDCTKSRAGEFLQKFQYPWEALDSIHDLILQIGPTLPESMFQEVKEHVWIANTAKVAPTASITAPCIIDEDAEVRHCAFIRGNAIVG